MKTMVILAVLFTSLLIMIGATFANVMGDCECYKIAFTDLDNPAESASEYEQICLDYANNIGDFAGCDISLFPSLITQGLASLPCTCVIHFKFHGNDNNVVTGEQFCSGERSIFWGHITDPSHCE